MDNLKDNKNKEEILYEYGSYKVSRDGSIYDILMNKRPVLKGGIVTLFRNGKRYNKKAARVVYEAVSGQKLTKCDVIKNKDGDETNIAFDNLYIEKRKNVMLKHFTLEQVEQIRKEYNKEEREKHGYRGIYAKPSYNEMCDKYNCSMSTMYKIINGQYL